MNTSLLKDSIGWGLFLWIVGYLLGIIFFFILPTAIIGWVIMPVGIFISIWVLMKKVKVSTWKNYLILAVVWTMIAILFDYLFIVKALNPTDGYYKLDVYLYYLLTFTMPLIVGSWEDATNSETVIPHCSLQQ